MHQCSRARPSPPHLQRRQLVSVAVHLRAHAPPPLPQLLLHGLHLEDELPLAVPQLRDVGGVEVGAGRGAAGGLRAGGSERAGVIGMIGQWQQCPKRALDRSLACHHSRRVQSTGAPMRQTCTGLLAPLVEAAAAPAAAAGGGVIACRCGSRLEDAPGAYNEAGAAWRSRKQVAGGSCGLVGGLRGRWRGVPGDVDVRGNHEEGRGGA